MTLVGWLQIVLLFLLVLACTAPLGAYLYRIFTGGRTWLTPVIAPIENAIYRLCRINPEADMSWQTYAFAIMGFSVIGFAYLYVLLRTQAYLPFNPQHFGNLAPDLAWNTAVSFLTNTNWQFYSGESTMSYLSQMAGLAWHNFVSAAMGIAVAVAVIRGFTRTDGVRRLGNFWVDLTRTTFYVLLPISIIGALVLIWQGMPQNFSPYLDVHTIDGAVQTVTNGPMASQEIIKELGTNGGGFVNANSSSPNENPTPLTNLIEMFSILLIGAALTSLFGRYAGNPRQGWVDFRGDGDRLVRNGRLRLCSRVGRQPDRTRARRERRQHGGQRNAVRRSWRPPCSP